MSAGSGGMVANPSSWRSGIEVVRAKVEIILSSPAQFYADSTHFVAPHSNKLATKKDAHFGGDGSTW